MAARVVRPLLLTVAALVLVPLALIGCDPAPAPPMPAPTPAVDEPPHGHTDDAAEEPTSLRAQPPGPRVLESDAALTDFLAGKTFVSIPGRDDRWTFHADGTYVADIGRRVTTGEWVVTATELHLTDRTVSRDHTMPARAPARVVPFRSLDGKLNVEIDGRQFRVE